MLVLMTWGDEETSLSGLAAKGSQLLSGLPATARIDGRSPLAADSYSELRAQIGRSIGVQAWLVLQPCSETPGPPVSVPVLGGGSHDPNVGGFGPT